ncbi:hypothetical protein [Kiritimatiella glycovorans]|uniref:Uncharacterized protein n=1 Tax=Kiritimatiella glycovorans TaxID=1307763 RepID=A0A0G3EHM6_9BACT|nr:hypothetical protein [Kiritimatiella glycovorans]AKJ64927.1 hypothetical protein L21SP4_01685 [Kiritimatiella glycovorans]
MTDRRPFSASVWERRGIVAIVLVTLVVIAVLLLAVWRPMRSRKLQHLEQIVELESRLSPYTEVPEEESLRYLVSWERNRYQRLRKRWERLQAHVRTFGKGVTLADILSTTEEGLIDYKVALYAARERIAARAAEKKVAVPADLGMSENIGAEESTETRLWQLASTTVLMDRFLETTIPEVTALEQDQPRQFVIGHTNQQALVEYPVSVEAVADYPGTLKLLEDLSSTNNFFALRRFWAERQGTTNGPVLKLRMICGAERFKSTRTEEELEEELDTPEEETEPEKNEAVGARRPEPEPEPEAPEPAEEAE